MKNSSLLKVGAVILGVLLLGGGIGWYSRTAQRFGGTPVSPPGTSGQTSPTGTVTGFANEIPYGAVTSGQSTLTSGVLSPLHLSLNGSLYTLTDPFWSASHTAAVASSSLANSAAVLGPVSCISSTGTTKFIQFHNASSGQLVLGQIPVFSFPLFAGQNRIIGTEMFGPGGTRFSNGITMVLSNATATAVVTGTDSATCDVLTR
jgi:hypothetical protein